LQKQVNVVANRMFANRSLDLADRLRGLAVHFEQAVASSDLGKSERASRTRWLDWEPGFHLIGGGRFVPCRAQR
jgi:hypothetical protein